MKRGERSLHHSPTGATKRRCFFQRRTASTASFIRRMTSRYSDWPKIAELYDGILITPYQPAYHLEVRWYYSWDVASACVWNLDCLERVS